MNFSLKKIQTYCEAMSTQPSELLVELERETYLKTLAPQMISGQFQGLFLYFLVRMIDPKKVLEIGTFTGYSSLVIAKGLSEDAILHTIEANVELEYIIKKYIDQLENKNQVKLHLGDAKTLIPNFDFSFDLIYIDAGKSDYELYFDLVIDKLNPGGFVLADNVLWSGKVVQKEHDKDTKVIHAFNEKVNADPRVENIILPIRDGLMLVRKK